MIELIIPGVPLPWKAPYVGTRGAWSPRWEVVKEFKRILQMQYDGPIIDVAINCDLIFYLPIPKSASKRKREDMLSGKMRPESTPDRTNLGKLYEDCLQGIVIRKDSKIVDGRVAKFYGDPPRTVILISKI